MIKQKNKKQNYRINYYILIFCGIICIAGVVWVEKMVVLSDAMKNNIISALISIGCGLFSSVVVSWFCEIRNQRLEDEKRKQMKYVLLYGFNETIEVYLKNDYVVGEDINLVINSNLVIDIPERINEFLLIGTFFYNEKELKYLITLRADAMGLISVIEQNNVKELFTKYKTIFYAINQTDLENGPYADCKNKIEEISENLDLGIDERTACKIGEFFSAYYSFLLVIRQFDKVFDFDISE